MLTSNFPLLNWHQKLLQSLRLPFWFACFLAIVGTAWRSPTASVCLITFCLALLIAVEWISRQLATKKLPKNEPVELMDDTVQQQIIRSQTADGQDRLDGTFWVEFPTETMTATVHIAFCPAFERIPKVQVFSVNETDVHFRVAPPKTFGVRVDVKRNNLEQDRLCFIVIAEG